MQAQVNLLATSLQSLDRVTLQSLLGETSGVRQDDGASGAALSMRALKDSMRPGLKDRILVFRASAPT